MTLARYAEAQVRQGRQVGAGFNIRDVSSRCAQRRKGLQVERLDQFDSDAGEWREILVEDQKAGPADIAASRIDFAAWLAMMSSLLTSRTGVMSGTGSHGFPTPERSMPPAPCFRGIWCIILHLRRQGQVMGCVARQTSPWAWSACRGAAQCIARSPVAGRGVEMVVADPALWQRLATRRDPTPLTEPSVRITTRRTANRVPGM
jgi:hypothetical protein